MTRPRPVRMEPRLRCKAPIRAGGYGFKEKAIGEPCDSTEQVELVGDVPLCWTHRKSFRDGLLTLPGLGDLEGNERWRKLGRGLRE